jgi:tRNA A-37 threonylcarbamoyl transferase component Bud32
MNKKENRKIVINPTYSEYKDFVERVPDIFSSEGKFIYGGRNEIRVLDVNGVPINVKRYKVPFFINRIVYTFFRQPKAVRAFEYAERLFKLGINTAEPIAYIMYRKYGLMELSYFISRQITDIDTMYEIAKLPAEDTRPIYEAFARFVAELHAKGVYHADLSPGNILYRKEGDTYSFYLIDINRMTFGSISFKKACANFARMWGCRETFRIIARTYAEATGYSPYRCEALILKYRDRFWKRYSRKTGICFE